MVRSNFRASFSTSRRGFAPVFLAAGALFCFLAPGGVAESSESSCCETPSGPQSSSSESGLCLFLEVISLALGFSVVCEVFFDVALTVVAFLGAALRVALGFALGFCVSSKNSYSRLSFHDTYSYRFRGKGVRVTTIVKDRICHRRIHGAIISRVFLIN